MKETKGNFVWDPRKERVNIRKHGISFNKAMRVFKKQCQREGFLVELKERRFYSKPSEKKRRKGSKRGKIFR